MKILYSFILLIILISIASASDSATLPIVKKGDCFVIQQSCPNCTYVNITSVKYPNQTLITLNYPMGSIGGTSWYNNSFCDSNETGTYLFDTKGNPDGVTDSQLIQIDVNPTGITPTLQRTIVNIFAILSMFIVSVMFFIGFMFIEHKPLKFSVGIFSIIFMFVGINLIFNILTNEIVDPKVTSLFEFISAASYYFYWLGGGIACILLFLTGLTSIQDAIKQNKARKYGGLDE